MADDWKEVVELLKAAGGWLPFQDLDARLSRDAIWQALGLGYIRFTQDMRVVLQEDQDPWDEIAEK